MTRAVIFDMDGVLLAGASLHVHTSRPVERVATEHALTSLGITDPDPDFLEANKWGSYANLVRSVADFDLEIDPAVIWPRRERKLSAIELESLATGERPFYDDTTVIDALAGREIPLGIASNARHRTVRGVVAHADWEASIGAIRGQHFDPMDWYRHKPEPDYIVDVIDQLGTTTGLYVGDAESDIVAAHRAGLESVFVRRPHNRDQDLDVAPDYTIDGLDDLLMLV